MVDFGDELKKTTAFLILELRWIVEHSHRRYIAICGTRRKIMNSEFINNETTDSLINTCYSINNNLKKKHT